MSVEQLALLGGEPEFKKPIPVGQLYFPAWDRYVDATKGIFDRQYYTNHGPLARELESRFEAFLDVEHVICVTNATIGLMMAAEALGLSGKVIVPSFTFAATPLSLSWCGLEPVFCDVDPTTHHPRVEHLEAVMGPDVSAYLGVNLWGSASEVQAIDAWAKSNNILTYWDSAQAIGCKIDDKPVGGFGTLEVFSLHATKIISAGEGGCIATNDGELAARLRNIRSSYGAGRPVAVTKTSNGRMSEFQAAVALMSLDDFEINRSNNKQLRDVYARCLAAIPGIELVPLFGVSASNYQNVAVRVDSGTFGVSRDVLLSVLEAEKVLARRYFSPGAHRIPQFSKNGIADLPNTDSLHECLLTLPVGDRVSVESVQAICNLMTKAQECADALAR